MILGTRLQHHCQLLTSKNSLPTSFIFRSVLVHSWPINVRPRNAWITGAHEQQARLYRSTSILRRARVLVHGLSPTWPVVHRRRGAEMSGDCRFAPVFCPALASLSQPRSSLGQVPPATFGGVLRSGAPCPPRLLDLEGIAHALNIRPRLSSYAKRLADGAAIRERYARCKLLCRCGTHFALRFSCARGRESKSQTGRHLSFLDFHATICFHCEDSGAPCTGRSSFSTGEKSVPSAAATAN